MGEFLAYFGGLKVKNCKIKMCEWFIYGFHKRYILPSDKLAGIAV